MSLFVLDTAGDQNLHKEELIKNAPITKRSKTRLLGERIDTKDLNTQQPEADDEYFGLPPPSVNLSALIDDTLAKTAVQKGDVARALENASQTIDNVLESVQDNSHKRRRRVFDLDHSDFNVATGKFDDEQFLKINPAQQLTGSSLKCGFEQLKALPRLGKTQLKKQNRIERAKTKGGEWYNLPATEITDEVKNELKILQMRAALDPKHFYKKNDLKVLPKYFQIGTVLPSPLDYYSERGTRKNKKRSLVDNLLADTEFQSYNKRKFNETMARKNKYAQRKATKKMKKLKKQK